MTNITLDAHGKPIDELWAAEFQGFFWGEGSLGLYQSGILHKHGRRNWRPQVTISARLDDAPIIDAIAARLGGRAATIRGYGRSAPSRRWYCHRREDCLRVIALLEGGVLPSKKRRELSLFKEILSAKHYTSRNYTPEEHERLFDLYLKLRMLKRYTFQVVTT